MGGFCSVYGVAVMKRSGYLEWIIVRVSAVVLLTYIALLLAFWVVNTQNDVLVWRAFLLDPAMRVLGVMASVALLFHSIIGAWVVLTDYVKIIWLQVLLSVFFYLIITLSCVFSIYALSYY